MTAYEDAVRRYFVAWNAATAEDLAKAVAAAFTEDATYTDPLADVRGHDGLAAAISGARQQFPGFEFKLTGTPTGTTTSSGSAGTWSPPPTVRRPPPGPTSSPSTTTGASAPSAASWTGSPAPERALRGPGGPAAQRGVGQRGRLVTGVAGRQVGAGRHDLVDLIENVPAQPHPVRAELARQLFEGPRADDGGGDRRVLQDERQGQLYEGQPGVLGQPGEGFGGVELGTVLRGRDVEALRLPFGTAGDGLARPLR